MKKTFISLFLLSLLTVFGPLSVKADPIVKYFGYHDGEWTPNGNVAQPSECCAGYIAASDKIVTGSDFYYSGKHQDAVERDGDNWTGFNGSNGTVKACTRTAVSLSASTTYTFSLLTKDKGEMDITLPKISIDGTNYVEPQKVLVNSVEQSFSNNQYRYTNNEETVLEYSITAPSSSSYTVSVQFTSGYRDKFKASTLTITQNAATYAVTVTASNGTVSGTGSYAEGATVTLTPSPNPYYAFSSWSGLTGVSVDDYEDDNPLTFTMPAGAVSVTANFVSSPCTNSKTIQCEDYDPEITKPSVGHSKPSNYRAQGQRIDGDDGGYGAAYGDAFASFRDSGNDKEIFYNIYLPAATYTFTVRCANGGLKKVVLYNAAGDEKLQELELGNEWTNDSWYNYTTSSWTASSSDNYYIGLRAEGQWAVFDQMTITASSNVFCSYDITLTKSEGGSANPTATVEEASVTAAMDGTTVTVTAAAASAGYNFSGWTASPEVTFAAASATSTTFTMPANAVTITANYEASVSSTFTYTTSGSGSITCDTPSDSDVSSGTVIEMTAVPSTDYVFTGWTASAGSFSDAAALITTFTMPAEAAAVTATFAQVDNVITVGSESGSSADIAGGGASITESNISDFDAFAHNVIKLAYSNMSGNDKWYGWNLGKQGSYNSANSAGATGFGFYYKTEAADDAVALWFDPNHGTNDGNQHGMQLPATNNVWKYVYFAHADANSWNKSYIRIFINGDKEGKSTANASGAIYLANIAATSVTSRPDIGTYQYTYNRDGAMKVNDYGTLCLPMAGTISGATLYSLAGKETKDEKLYIVLEDEGNTIVAGKPYITQSTATSYTVTMSGAHSDVQAGNGLVGTYTDMHPGEYQEEGPHYYILYANAFKKTGSSATVGAYRAYLDLDAVGAVTPAPGARRIRMVIEGTNSATGLEDLINDQLPVTSKVLIDGQLFIIRKGQRYTLTGARVQ